MSASTLDPPGEDVVKHQNEVYDALVKRRKSMKTLREEIHGQ